MDDRTWPIRGTLHFDTAVQQPIGKELRKGPRGGRIWKPRYFVHRVTWHVLDHAWEIEDRVII